MFQPGLFEVITAIRHGSLSAAVLWKLPLCREVLMALAAIGSILLTPRTIYHRNEFSYAPIREVAILFLGIFATMAPALQWLNANAHELRVRTPGQFYYASGALRRCWTTRRRT